MRAIAGKELRELWRDPLSLSLALALPLILLFLFTYGLNLDVPQVRLGVYDLDRSARSREYLASLTASGDLTVAGEAASVGELSSWLDRGEVTIALVVPPDFERTLLLGGPAPVQVLVDGAHPVQARAALAYLDAAASAFSHRLGHEAGGTTGATGAVVALETRVWFNPELKSINYVVPGLFSLILMAFAPLLSALAIVRERERGSIQQILAAPVSPLAFVVGKASPYCVLAFIDLLAVLALGLFWFQVPFRGSLLLFLVAAVVYVFCAVGVGLLVSAVTRSQVVAMLLVIVVTLMPSFLFSGFLFPIYSMPVRYQWLSLLFPARHFTETARALALKAATLEQLWPHLLALLAFAIVVVMVTTSRFHRRMG
ncbi:MAG: ABC transporter permease [Chloroflexi bacterium]|nr:ABC transporter permease [Chloroflexota bacterium]